MGGLSKELSVHRASRYFLLWEQTHASSLHRGNICMIYIHCGHYARLQPPWDELFNQSKKLE